MTAEAYGVIGIANPAMLVNLRLPYEPNKCTANNAADPTKPTAGCTPINPAPKTNTAIAPSLPHVQKVVCNFTGPYIKGKAIIYKPDFSKAEATLQSEFTVTEKCPDGCKTLSWHFHMFGDTPSFDESKPDTSQSMGPVFTSETLVLDTISRTANSSDVYFIDQFTPKSLLDHVGITLTLHSPAGGPPYHPTVAAAVCGIASPDTCIDKDGGCSKAVLIHGNPSTTQSLSIVFMVFIMSSSLWCQQ